MMSAQKSANTHSDVSAGILSNPIIEECLQKVEQMLLNRSESELYEFLFKQDDNFELIYESIVDYYNEIGYSVEELKELIILLPGDISNEEIDYTFDLDANKRFDNDADLHFAGYADVITEFLMECDYREAAIAALEANFSKMFHHA